MQLVTVEDNESSNPMKSGVQEADEDEMEDPDYEPNGTDSDDSLEYRSDTELTQDSQSQENESSNPMKSGVQEADEDEMEDPDYVPNGTDSDDSLKYRSDTELTQDSQSQEDEVTQDSQEDEVAVVELEDCPTTPNCVKVE